MTVPSLRSADIPTATVQQAGPDLAVRTGRDLALGTLSSILAKVVTAVAGIAVVAILARSLGPSQYGTLAIALTIAGTFGSLADLGLGAIVARDIAAWPARRRELAGALLWSRAAVAAMGLSLSALFVPYLTNSSEQAITFAIALASLPLGVATGLVVVSLGRLRPALAALGPLSQTVVWTIGVFLAAALSAPLPYFAAAFFAGVAAHALVVIVVNRRLVTPKIRGSGWTAMRLLQRYWPLAGGHLLFAVYHSFDAVAVALFAGSVQAGYYAGSYRFLETIQSGAVTVAGVFLPLLASVGRVGADNTRVSEIGRRVLRISSFLGIGACSALAIAAPFLVEVVFGSAYHDMIPVLTVVSLVSGGLFLETQLAAIIVAHDIVKPQFVLSMTTAVCSVVTWPVVIPAFGALGAAAVTLCLQLVRCAVLWRIAGRCSGWEMPTREVGVYVVFGVVAAGAASVFPGPAVGVFVLLLYVGAGIAFGGIRVRDATWVARSRGTATA